MVFVVGVIVDLFLKFHSLQNRDLCTLNMKIVVYRKTIFMRVSILPYALWNLFFHYQEPNDNP